MNKITQKWLKSSENHFLYLLRFIWIINRRHTHTHVLINKLNICVIDQLCPYQQEQILKPQTYNKKLEHYSVAMGNGFHQIHIGSICGLLHLIFHPKPKLYHIESKLV